MRRFRLRPRQEEGFTLVELLVSMGIFLTVASIFGTVYISISKSIAKQNGFVDAQEQSRQIFEQLDTQIRYASSVYAPTTPTSTTQWIDWEAPDPTLSSPGLRCYQWKADLAAGTLQYRTWAVPAVAGRVTTPAWAATYTGLVAGAVPVFTISPTDLYAPPYSLPSNGTANNAAASPAPSASATPGASLDVQLGVTVTVKKNQPTGTSAASTIFSALNATGTAVSPSCAAYVARS